MWVCLYCNHLWPVNRPCPYLSSLFGLVPLFSLIGCLVRAFLCCPFCSSTLCCSSYFHMMNGTGPPARLLVLNQISLWWLVNPTRQSGSLVFIFSHFRIAQVCLQGSSNCSERGSHAGLFVLPHTWHILGFFEFEWELFPPELWIRSRVMLKLTMIQLLVDGFIVCL